MLMTICHYEELLRQQREKNRNLIREITNYIPPKEYKYHPPSPVEVATAATNLGFMSKTEMRLILAHGL